MSVASSRAVRVTVIYDPLCGWCYGAAPAFRSLVEQPGLAVELLPSGLFSGAGARPLDDRFAAYAWAADQRIASLTGQTFSERYRDVVLVDRRAWLDSGPATKALTAVALGDPARELDALEAVQAARYVRGRDVTSPEVLADVLRGIGLEEAAARFLASDPDLLAAVEARTSDAQRRIQAVGARGVPTLLAAGRVVPSDGLYGNFDKLLHDIQAALARVFFEDPP